MLGRGDWIDQRGLGNFILECQDGEGGGIADRPDNVADAFHTFFGLGGLSLLDDRLGALVEEGGGLEGLEGPEGLSDDAGEKREGGKKRGRARKIDPIYALPTDVVESYGLGGQVVGERAEGDRLARYEKLPRKAK